jgi:hypothetical protein
MPILYRSREECEWFTRDEAGKLARRHYYLRLNGKLSPSFDLKDYARGAARRILNSTSANDIHNTPEDQRVVEKWFRDSYNYHTGHFENQGLLFQVGKKKEAANAKAAA